MEKKEIDQATYLKTLGKSTNQSMHLPFLDVGWLSDLSSNIYNNCNLQQHEAVVVEDCEQQ